MIPRELDVLLVERDSAVAGALCSALQKRGHWVRAIDSCEEALDLPRPDALVVADRPGGLNALELMRHYEVAGGLPRTVVISERPSLDACREALRAGAADYLATPYRLEELIRAVETHASHRANTGDGDAPRLLLALPAAESSLSRVARELGSFCVRSGLGPSTRARVVSATLELVENAVVHAYPDGAGTVEVEAGLDPRECFVRVIDQGVGFDPDARTREHEDGLAAGLARAAGCAEALHVSSAPGGGATIELRFRAWRVDFDEAGTIDLSEYDWFTPETSREVLRTLATPECEDLFTLSPALAVLVGRLLSGPRVTEALTALPKG